MAGQFQYARLARTAQRLIDRFGKTETIKGYFDTPNPSQPNRPGIRTFAELTPRAVFLNIEAKLIDGTLVKAGDMKVLVGAVSPALDPKITGTITRGDEVWSIVKIEPLNPGGIKLLYTLQVRK